MVMCQDMLQSCRLRYSPMALGPCCNMVQEKAAPGKGITRHLGQQIRYDKSEQTDVSCSFAGRTDSITSFQPRPSSF